MPTTERLAWTSGTRATPGLKLATRGNPRLVTDAARHFATFGLAPAAASSMRVITTPTKTLLLSLVEKARRSRFLSIGTQELAHNSRHREHSGTPNEHRHDVGETVGYEQIGAARTKPRA